MVEPKREFGKEMPAYSGLLSVREAVWADSEAQLCWKRQVQGGGACRGEAREQGRPGEKALESGGEGVPAGGRGAAPHGVCVACVRTCGDARERAKVRVCGSVWACMRACACRG